MTTTYPGGEATMHWCLDAWAAITILNMYKQKEVIDYIYMVLISFCDCVHK